MNWFYAKDGQPAGPADDAEFERLIASGAIGDATLVWHSGLADWKPYGELRANRPPPLVPPPAGPVPPEGPVPAIGLPQPMAPAALSTAAPAHGPAADGALPYAGFWIRVAACIFDGLILLPLFLLLYFGFMVAFPDFLAGYPAGAHAGMLFDGVFLTTALAYQTFFVGRFGASPGKMVCNLRVIEPDGSRISYRRALGRYLCIFVSCLFFGAGFFVFVAVALNPQRCALHDFLCDTRVIHTDSLR